LTVLLAPNDVLDRWAWARQYNDIALQTFPFMRRHAPHSPFVQVIQFAASMVITLIWLQSLIMLIIVLPDLPAVFLRVVKKVDDRWTKPIFASLMFLVMGAGSLATRNGPDMSRLQMRIDMSRLTTAFLESTILFYLPAALLILVLSLYGSLTRSTRRV
jgi:hypothetical protein